MNCLADGVLVDINLRDKNFNGVMYVKGHSNDERCRQAIDVQQTGIDNIDFKVQFGTCGLFHNDVSILKVYTPPPPPGLPHHFIQWDPYNCGIGRRQ